MLEVAPNNRHNGDRLAEILHSGPQHADATHVQANVDSRPRGRVQRLDDFRIDERIHLRPNLSGLPGFSPPPLTFDQPEQSLPQHGWSRYQLSKLRRVRIAGQCAEKSGGVGAEVRVRRHQAEVRVQARSPVVVVAGSAVHVSPQSGFGAFDDETDLCVHLVVADAVDDVGAHFFESPCPLDVSVLVEACLQLDDDSNLFTLVGCPGEPGDDG